MDSINNRIRKLKSFEYFYDVAIKDFNFMITCYWFKFESAQRLNPAQIEQALLILFKNSDNLSLCLREYDGETWFCRMEKDVIDFEVLRNSSPCSVMEEEINKSFNCKEGPLWRTKYLLQENNELNIKNSKVDGKNFISDILFTYHHIMMDGFTTFNMCRNFLEILNDIMEGSVKKIYENFGKFNDGSETDELIQNRLEFLQKNPHIYNDIKCSMKEISKINVVLDKIYPVPNDVGKRTKHIIRDLSKDLTSRIINMFKSKGISFHAGFTSVANWALVEVLTENGCSLETFDIGAFHALNIRRYWRKSSEIQQGCHIGPLRMVVKTDRNVGTDFWQYAKHIHDLLRKYINECRSVDEILSYPLITQPGDTFADLFRNPPPLCLYYSTTNMGDVTSYFENKRKYVNVNWLTRTTSCQNLNIAMVHVMQTYEGKFLYGLDYATNYVREDLACKYVDKIFSKLNFLLNKSSY